MKAALLFVAVLVLASPAHADVYKCIENGRVTYSDQPCAGEGGLMHVRPSTGSVSSSESDDDPEAAAADAQRTAERLENMRKFSQQAENERRIREMDSKISKAQARIAELEARQAREMASLEHRRKAVDNDLSDISEKTRIAKKLDAATLKHESKMKRERAALERLQKERDKLD